MRTVLNRSGGPRSIPHHVTPIHEGITLSMPPLDLTPHEAALARRPSLALAVLPEITLNESPAAVYLAQLAPSGRRSMQQALTAMAKLIG